MSEKERNYEVVVSSRKIAYSASEVVVRHSNNYLVLGGVALLIGVLGVGYMFMGEHTLATEEGVLAFWVSVIAIILCVVAALYTYLYTYRWKLVLKDDAVYYTPSYRPPKTYRLDEITFHVQEDRWRFAPAFMRRELGNTEGPHTTIDIKKNNRFMFAITSRDRGFYEFSQRLDLEIPDYSNDNANFVPRPSLRRRRGGSGD